MPYPDLACFGKFNKPLWQKQGIAQRPREFLWYLLPIPQGPSSDTHVDSLRTCRNFSTVLFIKKKNPKPLVALCLETGSAFPLLCLETLFLEWSFSNRISQSEIFHDQQQSNVISYLESKIIISYSSTLSIRV